MGWATLQFSFSCITALVKFITQPGHGVNNRLMSFFFDFLNFFLRIMTENHDSFFKLNVPPKPQQSWFESSIKFFDMFETNFFHFGNIL